MKPNERKTASADNIELDMAPITRPGMQFFAMYIHNLHPDVRAKFDAIGNAIPITQTDHGNDPAKPLGPMVFRDTAKNLIAFVQQMANDRMINPKEDAALIQERLKGLQADALKNNNELYRNRIAYERANPPKAARSA